ncbi:AAA family ATPase [Nonlabens ponticola]|uniref:DUF4357 domain-containing protein n=1 Tax=Nonlabens ponticola TaxID=2496866 RepID=A0A3S9MXW9_9FLAO|nr:AAA family ATPase [Nonlabens ponticola]AZQ44105.1 DUF4357 domain-containing protein [Nonlabens ponticola]
MKITKLAIDGYKNLEIKLVHSSDIIALIGNNGSGKSNLLEALSYIFRSLYRETETVSFDYFIEYTNLAQQTIKIEKKKSKTTAFVNDVSTINISQYLPKKVIALYSGEEDRLWRKCYFPFYGDYVSNINKSSKQGLLQSVSLMPQMLYLNKFYWHISLLALIISDLDDNKVFVKDVLGITQVDKISFQFKKDNYSEYNDGSVLDFIKIIDKKSEYTLKEFKKLINDNDYIPDDVYKLLYVAFTPKSTKIISDIVIRFNEHLSIEDLSEGEKKLLLIKSAFEFASQEDSLFILDEPDAHIHLNNKEQIIKTFNPYKSNRQIVVTTHSPTVTKSINDDSLFMVNDGKIIPKEKQEIIDDLTGDFWNKHQQSSFLSSDKKIILLVEGKHDLKHIKTAFKALSSKYPSLDFDIFSLKGETNIAPMLKGIRDASLNNNKLYIGIYDNDTAGNSSLTKGGFLPIKGKQYRILKDNDYSHYSYYALALPKPKGFKGDCTIENMYSCDKFEEAYIESLEQSKGYFNNKSIDDISEDIKLKAKNILSLNSTKFEESDFDYFIPLFDYLEEIRLDSISSIAAMKAKSMMSQNKKKDSNKNDKTEKKKPLKLVALNTQKGSYTEEDHFKNRTGVIVQYYKDLRDKILALDENLKVVPKKDYIAFKKKSNVVDITIQTKQLKIWINKKKGTLDDPKGITKDVAGKGHWGNGDYEIVLKLNDNTANLIELIKKAL